MNRSVKDKFRTFIAKMLQHGKKNQQQIASRKIETTRQAHLPHLPQDYTIGQNEIDAFRMKAIVLLKKDSILGTPLNNLLKGPIEVEKTDVGNEENKKTVFHLSQRFEWSGSTYQLEGKFLKDQTRTRSIPITDSFKLTLHNPAPLEKDL
jgi:hypothetical protein